MSDGSHSHGPGSSGGFADNVAGSAGVIVGVIGGAILLGMFIHWLVIIAACLGFVVIGAGTGYGAVRLRRWRRRREVRAAGTAVMPAQPRAWPVRPGEADRPALGPGEVHLHFHGTSAEDVAAVIRRQGGR